MTMMVMVTLMVMVMVANAYRYQPPNINTKVCSCSHDARGRPRRDPKGADGIHSVFSLLHVLVPSSVGVTMDARTVRALG